jgi:hypothetical protein
MPDDQPMMTSTPLPTSPSVVEPIEQSAAAPKRRPFVRRAWGPLFEARTWKETVALLVALPLGTVWFTALVTGLSLSAGLMITIVGLPLLLLVLLLGRAIAAVERGVAGALLDLDVEPFAPLRTDGSAWARLGQALSDPPSWKGVGYGVLALPFGIATFTTTVVLWSVAAGMATFPITQLWMSGQDDVPVDLEPFVEGWGRVGSTAAIGVAGLALLAVTPRGIHALASVQRRVVTTLASAGARREA